MAERQPRARLNIFLAPSWVDKLKEISSNEDKSLCEILREAVHDYLRKKIASKAVGPITDYLGPTPDDEPVTESEAAK